MQHFKKIGSKIIWPGLAVMVLLAAVSAALLCYTVLCGEKDTIISYLAYIVSTYTLIVVVCRIIKTLKEAKRAVYANPYANRFLTDVPYRVRISLYGSFIINLAYAFVKLVSGIVYHSVWFGAIAVYYMVLCLMRALLVAYAGKHDFGKDKKYEYRIYRRCGILILILNMALAGVVIQMARGNRGYHYPGMLIYIAAIFTFYAVISAAFNLARYRRYDSPVISAVKAVNFATAAVSVLSLQTAMLTEFGGDYHFVKFMNSATGCIVCLLILGTAFYMIVNASRHLRMPDQKEEKNA